MSRDSLVTKRLLVTQRELWLTTVTSDRNQCSFIRLSHFSALTGDKFQEYRVRNGSPVTKSIFLEPDELLITSDKFGVLVAG